MKNYSAEKIKNIAFLGHGGSGKTTLADAILYYGKAADRIGKTQEGTALLDFDPEEKKRGSSVSTSVYALELNGYKLNLIDAPGQFDFAGGICEALAAADSAVIAISGKSGLTVGAKQAYDKAKSLGKGIAFFVGKLDSSHAHFYRVISSLVANYGAVVCPVVVPYIEDEAVKCYVNLIENKAYAFEGVTAKEFRMPVSTEIDQMRDMLLEAVASADEELMEKYFGGEEFTNEELIGGLKKGIASGDICPVYCGVQQSGDAISLFADSLCEIMPSPEDKGGENAIHIFKTIADPFVGKLSYFKVISGKITPDTRLKNARNGEEERLSKIMWIKGGKLDDAQEITAGDIGSVSKLSSALTGDTLSASGSVKAETIDFPAPNLSVAVYPKNKGDEEKITAGLNRLMEEDPTVCLKPDKETKEQILWALGEQHIDVIVSRLKAKFGTEVELKKPKIAYRETIRKPVKAQG